MTDRDIAFLLADAANEAEIGMAPVQAVLRGGRRRRARRWAVATATALVLAGSTGATLAVAGLPSGGGHRVVPAATPPPTTGRPDVFQPANAVTLALGTDQGKRWKVAIDVWPAPRDEAEAQSTLNAMRQYGETPPLVHTASELVGKSAYFVRRSFGDTDALGTAQVQGTTTKVDKLAGTDLVAYAGALNPDSDMTQRLVIGHVARTAQQVTCTWKDGTTTVIGRAPSDGIVDEDQLAIRQVANSPYAWFVCVAPKNTAYKTVKVTG
ncbi:hypothetical protein ACH4ND_27840 [Streptomyces sp. NPDC017179]|uniref:hypothetical protein n=1 Tax=Streptomyces sp. NPDC017179 TaxID=3364979 RepID=UPI0037A245A7